MPHAEHASGRPQNCKTDLEDWASVERPFPSLWRLLQVGLFFAMRHASTNCACAASRVGAWPMLRGAFGQASPLISSCSNCELDGS